ncbi:MAG: hypothetical protein AB8B55_22740 [Mariniblastus sp.]
MNTKSKGHHAAIRFWLAAPVGIPIVYLLMAAFMGDFVQPLALIAFSIICTAGIGLVVWLPIFWLVGWIAISLFRLFSRNQNDNGSTESGSPSSAQLSVPDPALMRYMAAAKANGMDDASVTKNLANAGWSFESIALAAKYFE